MTPSTVRIKKYKKSYFGASSTTVLMNVIDFRLRDDVFNEMGSIESAAMVLAADSDIG